jgi:hypothetical protein
MSLKTTWERSIPPASLFSGNTPARRQRFRQGAPAHWFVCQKHNPFFFIRKSLTRLMLFC